MPDKAQIRPGSKPHSSTPLVINAAALMALWLVLSGHFDWFHVSLGVLSVAIVLSINRPPSAPEKDVALGDLRFSRLLLYIPWLGKEMVLSALHVAKVTLTPRLSLNPCLILFKSEQPNETARMFLGNSITLTPGTLTVDLDHEEFFVHALTPRTAAGLLSGAMQRKVARLFTDQPGQMVFNVRQTPESSR